MGDEWGTPTATPDNPNEQKAVTLVIAHIPHANMATSAEAEILTGDRHETDRLGTEGSPFMYLAHKLEI